MTSASYRARLTEPRTESSAVHSLQASQERKPVFLEEFE
jgi:hypothetical protein